MNYPPSLRLRFSTTPRWLAPFAWSLLCGPVALWGCSAAGPSQPRAAVAQAPDSDQVASGLSESEGGAGGSAEDDYTHELSPQLDLRRFAPLLDLPQLESVRAHERAGRYGDAARELSLWLERNPQPILDEPRLYLLLGSLQMRGGNVSGAARSYERSGKISWPLQDYALMGWGRALMVRGRRDEAYRVLQRVASGSTAGAAQGLAAEMSCPTGQTDECVAQLRTFTAPGLRPGGWARKSFELMDSLSVQLLSQPESAKRTQGVQRAIAGLRLLMTRAPNTASAMNAGQTEERLLAALPDEIETTLRAERPEQKLIRLRALAEAQRRDDTETVAKALLAQIADHPYTATGCEAQYLWGRVLSSRSDRERGVRVLRKVIENCSDPNQRAWSLYLAGKYSFRLERYAQADQFFAKLELEAPAHRLADDARLYRAKAQREMGVNTRFVQLLSTMAKDYPKGDMTSDGVFALALHSIQRGNWSAAADTLRELADQDLDGDLARGPEWAGRERYFYARSLIETGEVERGLQRYEALMHQLPLSYYMLHAYSRLRAADPARAAAALAREVEAGRRQSFEVQARPEFEHAGFIRFIELMRQGQLDAARNEAQLLNLGKKASRSPLLWGVSELWAQAGSSQFSHLIPRHRLRDWQRRWPVGSWSRAWQLAFPRPFKRTVLREAQGQNVEPQLVFAVMREESAFNPDAVSGANAYGLMQVIPLTARAVGKKAGIPYDRNSLTRPEVSIALGSRVLSGYSNQFPKDPLLAIPGYNAGTSRPKRWLREHGTTDFDVWVELIPYRETRRYTKRVLGSRAAYAFLYFSEERQEPSGDSLQLPLRVHPPNMEPPTATPKLALARLP